MDSTNWNSTWTMALVLAGGALAGWLVMLLLYKLMGGRGHRETSFLGADADTAPREPGRKTAAPKKSPAAEEGWADTVLVAPGSQGPEAATAAGPRPDDPDLQPRHAQGLLLLSQRRYDSAWAALSVLPPDDPSSRSLLAPLERLAQAFEEDQRFEQARAVYERMADIDPTTSELKPKLVRARGLAMATRTGTLDLNATQPGLVNAASTPAANPSVPARIGRFVIQGEIGRGAMGAVYLAHDPNRVTPVALKTLALSREFNGPELADARSRFFREAEMAGRLHHPNIVQIFDSGELDGLAYIAMEWVRGEDLSTYATPSKLLPVPLLLRVACRVAEALAYAHSKGVTHRDVKPANIMVDLTNDVVKVMDFGVARITDSTRTRTGVVLGTPSFMSPEQLAGQRVDGRTDLYALGVSLFQLLTGQLPFHHASMAALMRAIANEPAPDVRSLRPDLPEALANVVALALEKHPDVRYADGTLMAADLRAVGASLRIPVDNRAHPPLSASQATGAQAASGFGPLSSAGAIDADTPVSQKSQS